jgi:hypothetical protein
VKTTLTCDKSSKPSLIVLLRLFPLEHLLDLLYLHHHLSSLQGL